MPIRGIRTHSCTTFYDPNSRSANFLMLFVVPRHSQTVKNAFQIAIIFSSVVWKLHLARKSLKVESTFSLRNGLICNRSIAVFYLTRAKLTKTCEYICDLFQAGSQAHRRPAVVLSWDELSFLDVARSFYQ
ncbi:unnamed protein product [Albugo candida]|uniref:Uncharacterized protein n=1 Tax=Albugo candida TaxID=65357 RepID=A0A024FWK4_9STRA|nr:unnamed protein product [Albugo candida]|eukprot:CCI11019.1 unnamed protein product [Albugo candida]